ncbi:solute carrier family 22 member 8-like [Octopus sinensis]|uniref:Solute carrier family 22 member 8-like n=1 Tax=Octopus sinensis TaxID=2607531 RepID=A0A7E6F8K0_9MOLL|nr:solute carrier family 22 member 8-like [Octopus sinensis]
MMASEVNVDEIMDNLGDGKFFHTTQYIIFSTSLLISAYNTYFYVFTTLSPEYRCQNLTDIQLDQYNISSSEVDLIYDKCSIQVMNTNGMFPGQNRSLPCLNGYHYSTPVRRSIISEWDLVCSKEGLAETTQTLYTFGQLISGFLSTYFIDKYGRKPTRILSNFFLIILNLICAFSPFYGLFAAMRFLIGFFREAYTITTFTAIPELYSKRKRIIMSSMSAALWSLANSFPGWTAYLLKDYNWDVFHLFNALLSIYCILEIFFLEESIRWLFANSKIKKAKRVIKTAAKQNRVDFERIWNIALKEMSLREVSGHVNENFCNSRGSDPKVTTDDTTLKHTGTCVGKEVTKPVPSLISSKNEESKFVLMMVIFKSAYLRKVTLAICFCCQDHMQRGLVFVVRSPKEMLIDGEA